MHAGVSPPGLTRARAEPVLRTGSAAEAQELNGGGGNDSFLMHDRRQNNILEMKPNRFRAEFWAAEQYCGQK